MMNCIKIVLLLIFPLCLTAQVEDDLVPFRKGNQWGFANSSRQIVIPVKYDEVGLFHEGTAWVKKNNKYAYIQSNGKMRTKFKFDEASNFSHGQAYVTRKKKKYFIDKKGCKTKALLVCGGVFSNYSYFEVYQKEEKFGAISQTPCYENNMPCRDTIPAIYDEIQENTMREHGVTSFLLVRQNDKWGTVNHKGKVVTPIVYDAVKKSDRWVHEAQFTKVEKDGKWGFISNEGAILIEPKYKEADFFYKKVAKVKRFDGAEGYIDTKGTEYFD